jgi:hypothetical protein
MHLARLLSGDLDWVQACARVEGASGGFLKGPFDRLVSLWPTTGAACLGVRVRFDTTSRLAVTVFLTGPRSEADLIRRFFARLTLLAGVEDTLVTVPEDAGEADALRRDWPSSTVALNVGDLQTQQGDALSCRAVWPDLRDLALETLSAWGLSASLHVNIAPSRPSADAQKRWSRQVLAIETATGLPADLLAHQQRGLAAARAAEFQVESFWGAADQAAARRLSGLLDEIAHRREPAVFAPLAFHDVLPQAPDAVSEALHSTALAPETIAELTGQCSPDEARQAAAWPAALLGGVLSGDGASPGAGGKTGVALREMPPVLDADQYAFISYAHSDAPAVFSVLRALHELGFPYWYDRGLAAGEEWDAELETRLHNCKAVIAFLSPQAVNSRYCRREIKYADILAKPIAPVVLERTPLAHGLAFTLASVQSIDVGDPQLVHRLSAFFKSLR